MPDTKPTHEDIMDGLALAARDDVDLVAPDAGGNLFADAGSLAHGWRCAQVFARSKIIPEHLQGKPNDCLIALHMSNQMGVDPLMVMQNMFVVKGTPGWKTQFIIARANALGAWQKRINWRSEGEGSSLVVTAYAVRSDGDKVEKSVSMKMAIADGWTRNDKYKSMPEEMLEYRSAAFLIRRHCPEATMGYMTTEELEDVNSRQASPAIASGSYASVDTSPVEPPEKIVKQVNAPSKGQAAASAEAPDVDISPERQYVIDGLEKLGIDPARLNEKLRLPKDGNVFDIPERMLPEAADWLDSETS